ncbi:MAG: hypothetical protein AB1791_00210 [Chloroflexota bacterium]
MSNLDTPSPPRVRIHTHVTQTRFLHIEDALNIGKLRLFAGSYHRGQGMDSHAYHFLDLADARVVFGALVQGEANFNYKEYKGSPPQADQPAVSRILSVNAKGENVYFELKSGPGKVTSTGAITPNGPAAVEVNVAFKLYEARRLAAAVLSYIQAWDVLRMLANQHLPGKPTPYPLASSQANGHGSSDKPARLAGNASRPPASPGPAVAMAGHNRPVTRKGPVPKAPVANGAAAPTTNGNGKSLPPTPPAVSQPAGPEAVVLAQAVYGPAEKPAPPPSPLRYRDGSLANADNAAEVQAFQRFVTEKKTAPASRAVLRTYYEQQVAA